MHKCKSTRLETYGLLGLVFNTTFHKFQLYRGGQFYWWRKTECTEKTTDLPQVTYQILSHNVVSPGRDSNS
jgi:hypothetical protein